MFVPLVTYGSETMIWKKKESSRIRAVQMDNLRGLLGIRRMNKVPNARIRQLCGVTKDVDEKIDGSVIWREWRITGLLRGSMLEIVLVVTWWVSRGRGGLIP